MKKIVLVDIDCTLNNFQEIFIKTFKSCFPEFNKHEIRTHFDAFKLDKEKSMSILMAESFNKSLSPLENAVEAVKEIEKNGFTVFFCTSVVTDISNTMRDRVQWIGKWFGEKWMNQVIFTNDKTMVHGDFLIDDSPSRTKGCRKPDWKLIYFDTSYNHDCDCAYRIYSWNNIEELLNVLKSK